MPALLIQAGGFLYHLQGKRQEARAHAAVAEADALQAGTRATVMEGLVTFGQAVVGNAKETRRDIERAREGRGAGDPHRRRVGAGRDCGGRPLCMR